MSDATPVFNSIVGSTPKPKVAAAVWRGCPSLEAAQAWFERLKVIRLVSDADPVLAWDVELHHTGGKTERVEAAVLVGSVPTRTAAERIYDCSEDFIAGWRAAASDAAARQAALRDRLLADGLRKRAEQDRRVFGTVAVAALDLAEYRSVKRGPLVAKYDGYWVELDAPTLEGYPPRLRRAKDITEAAGLFLEAFLELGVERYTANFLKRHSF